MPALYITPLVLALLAPTFDSSAAPFPLAMPDGRREPAFDALQRFAASDLDGQRWTAADLRGRVVLLDFWATWCAPCLAELPRLKNLRSRYSREDFEILGISLDVTSRQSFVSWLNRNRIEWPQVHERAGYSGNLAKLFGIDRLPRTILIDRDGRVVALDVRGEQLARLVSELVAENTGERVSARVRR